MEEDFPESSVDEELLCSKTEDLRLLQDLNRDTLQDPDGPKQDLEQQSSHSGLDQVQGQDKDSAQDEAKHKKCDPDQPQDQLEGHGIVQNPAGGQDLSQVHHHGSISVSDQDLLGADQDQDRDWDQDQRADLVGASDQGQDQGQGLPAANEAAALESGGGVPALVITEAEELLRSALLVPVRPAGSPVEPQQPADLEVPAVPPGPSLSSSSDRGDMVCSDLLSLRSDSLSLASEAAVSRTSEEDDRRSVAASSLMSLFHRVQLDPLEKLWWRSSALGNMAAQRRLLAQEPSLVLKKDFVSTALHWAAKQGRQEVVDMMLHSGADVNARSGYTPLHLASIHGHQHVIHALINTHQANSSIRDYHGKTAVHYWSGCSDVFNKPQTQSGGTFVHGRRTQRYALPSLLMTRSRSQGQLNLEFGTTHDVLDLHL